MSFDQIIEGLEERKEGFLSVLREQKGPRTVEQQRKWTTLRLEQHFLAQEMVRQLHSEVQMSLESLAMLEKK